jgi:hypothetical protein
MPMHSVIVGPNVATAWDAELSAPNITDGFEVRSSGIQLLYFRDLRNKVEDRFGHDSWDRSAADMVGLNQTRAKDRPQTFYFFGSKIEPMRVVLHKAIAVVAWSVRAQRSAF